MPFNFPRTSHGNEPTLLTNFMREDRLRYEEALRIYGRDDIEIRESAFDAVGRACPSMNSLHTKKLPKDASDFWRIWETLK